MNDIQNKMTEKQGKMHAAAVDRFITDLLARNLSLRRGGGFVFRRENYAAVLKGLSAPKGHDELTALFRAIVTACFMPAGAFLLLGTLPVCASPHLVTNLIGRRERRLCVAGTAEAVVVVVVVGSELPTVHVGS